MPNCESVICKAELTDKEIEADLRNGSGQQVCLKCYKEDNLARWHF